MISPMVFALSPSMQKEEIEKYCYGNCGKALSGDMHIDVFGNLKTCNQRNCGFEIKRMEISKGVCLRTLGLKHYQDAPKGLSI